MGFSDASGADDAPRRQPIKESRRQMHHSLMTDMLPRLRVPVVDAPSRPRASDRPLPATVAATDGLGWLS